MAESTLVLTFSDMKGEVGFFLGFLRDSAAWSTEQAATIDAVVQSGLRNFYFPAPIPGTGIKAHEWTFLRPIAAINTVDGQYAYDLPDDFGGIDGDLTIHTDSQSYPPIVVMSEAKIRAEQAANPTLTKYPDVAAVRPKSYAGGGAGQRFELWFWPTPDAAYTVKYRYRVLPSKLVTASPCPYGGAQHSETILESCLAVAEKRLDNVAGTHAAEFLSRLAASISLDAANTPEHFGYNGNGPKDDWRCTQPRLNSVTYNGVQY